MAKKKEQRPPAGLQLMHLIAASIFDRPESAELFMLLSKEMMKTILKFEKNTLKGKSMDTHIKFQFHIEPVVRKAKKKKK